MHRRYPHDDVAISVVGITLDHHATDFSVSFVLQMILTAYTRYPHGDVAISVVGITSEHHATDFSLFFVLQMIFNCLYCDLLRVNCTILAWEL